MDAGSICWNPVALAEKTWLMVNADCPHVIHRTDKGTNTMGVKHSASIGVGRMNGEFDETGMELCLEFRKAEFSEDGEVTIHAIEIDD